MSGSGTTQSAAAGYLFVILCFNLDETVWFARASEWIDLFDPLGARVYPMCSVQWQPGPGSSRWLSHWILSVQRRVSDCHVVMSSCHNDNMTASWPTCHASDGPEIGSDCEQICRVMTQGSDESMLPKISHQWASEHDDTVRLGIVLVPTNVLKKIWIWR